MSMDPADISCTSRKLGAGEIMEKTLLSLLVARRMALPGRRKRREPLAAKLTDRWGISPYTGRTIILEDILFGDVFLCGGQSNMALNLRVAFEGERFIEEANRRARFD